MTANAYNQIHMIPFDTGTTFVDVLSFDNGKNLHFAVKFIDALKKYYRDSDSVEVVEYLDMPTSGKKEITLKCVNDPLCDNAVCVVKFSDRLHCYILGSGVGVFVLIDDGKWAEQENEQLKTQNLTIKANYRKKRAQMLLLNEEYENNAFGLIKQIMLEFRRLCWRTVREGIRKKEVLVNREFSGSEKYKRAGLSYVLTIYQFNGADITQRETVHLMYSPVYANVLDKSKWSVINAAVNEEAAYDNCSSVKAGEDELYFSWSAVGVLTPVVAGTLDELKTSVTLSSLIKAEFYVQSRWFIADNSLDNVNKNHKLNLEKLQRIESLIEHEQAELENEISANMQTIYKKILKPLIVTSEIKQLHHSVLCRIRMQRRLLQARLDDKRGKNRLMVNCFLAIFTASSLYKTVTDLLTHEFSWTNVAIFGSMLLVAVGAVIFEHFNKK